MKSAIRNFMIGLSSAFNIFPDPPRNPVEGTTDAERLYSDWVRVGDNLRNAMEKVASGRVDNKVSK